MKSLKRFVLLLLILLPATSWARYDQRANRTYKMEIGVQAGTAYYMGETARMPFMQPKWTAGGQLRYKFDKRWSLAGHALFSDITVPASTYYGTKANTKNTVNADITAEFNFLNLSGNRMTYSRTDYTVSPYIFLGIGGMMYKAKDNGGMGKWAYTGAPYMPFGIGLKWMLGGRYGLNVRWQHNLLLGFDNLEGIPELDYKLNGSDITNFDMTGQLMVGFVVEFAQGKRACRMCL